MDVSKPQQELEDDEEEDEVSVADEKDATVAYELHMVESERSGARVLHERNAEDILMMQRAAQTEGSIPERWERKPGSKENAGGLLSIQQHLYMAQKQRDKMTLEEALLG